MPKALETPHPVPNRLRPALAGTAVIVLGLPVFLLVGWPVGAWGFAALLWAVFQLIGIVLGRLPMGMGTLGTSGVAAFGRMFRVIALMTVLIVVTTRNQDFGLSAALLFALAFTVEFGLSLASYASSEPFPRGEPDQ
jgi:hypothetical protein